MTNTKTKPYIKENLKVVEYQRDIDRSTASEGEVSLLYDLY